MKCYLFGKMDQLIQAIQEIDTQTNEPWWSDWSNHRVTNFSSHLHKPLARLIT